MKPTELTDSVFFFQTRVKWDHGFLCLSFITCFLQGCFSFSSFKSTDKCMNLETRGRPWPSQIFRKTPWGEFYAFFPLFMVPKGYFLNIMALPRKISSFHHCLRQVVNAFDPYIVSGSRVFCIFLWRQPFLVGHRRFQGKIRSESTILMSQFYFISLLLSSFEILIIFCYLF